MGIRFRCPNGHKIHVKDFLAGKRGICPVCGLKVPIPQESDPEFAGKPSKRRPTSPRTAAPPSSASRSASQPAPTTAAQSTAQLAAGPVPSVKSKSPVSENDSPGQSGVGGPTTPAERGGASDSVHQDPIAAAPHARWFVRPPSGGQFGPAPGHVLREWMAEGRVTPETYVWCEGWPEWQRAHAVFGDMGRPTGPMAVGLPEVSTAPKAKSASELYRQRKSSKMTLATVGLLTIACGLLFAALVYVIRFMK